MSKTIIGTNSYFAVTQPFTTMNKPSALIAGATGLVGQHLLSQLLADDYFGEIIIICRNELLITDPRVTVLTLKDFDQLEDYHYLFNVDQVFCCLGSNMRDSLSKEAFRKVNLDYPLKMAELSVGKARFKTFHVITSVGANKSAMLYYNTVKWQLEYALKHKDIPNLKIYQPSLLLGKKANSSSDELLTMMASALNFLVIKKQQVGPSSIHGSVVARAMYVVAKMKEAGESIYKPKEMLQLSGQIVQVA
ncbi:MAG: hypothetical protein ACI8QD_001645 [Cyclobacteriaceae bacterium]|jgi:uncharacterized protein YbjT (DUF2867 family)